jgi:hypothetical protein
MILRLLVAIGLLVTFTQAADAAPSLKDRATKLKAFLPKAPAGWSMVEEQVIAQDSAMSGRELGVTRKYRKGKAEEEIVIVHIGIQPNGSPLDFALMVDDADKAAKAKINDVPFVISEVLGQKAASRTFKNPLRSRDEHTVIHKLENGMMVTYEIWSLPVTAAEPFKKKIDYKKLGALKI